MTQELPDNNYLTWRRVEQLPTDALSQIDYGHTRHCERFTLDIEDWIEVCLGQLKSSRVFWKIWVGVYTWPSENLQIDSSFFASYRTHTMNDFASLRIFMIQGRRTQRKQNHWLLIEFLLLLCPWIYLLTDKYISKPC